MPIINKNRFPSVSKHPQKLCEDQIYSISDSSESSDVHFSNDEGDLDGFHDAMSKDFE